MRYTLGQAKAQIDISGSIGIASCDSRFIALVNSAQRYLADKGRWWGTYQRMYICMDADVITWPREVANVEAFKICHTGVTLVNEWYEFAEAVREPDRCGCGPPMLLDRPLSPQFIDTSSPQRIRLYPTTSTDVGKKVILQGIDNATGRAIRTQVGSTFINGEQLTIAEPFVTSTFTYRQPGLSGVQKPVTNGSILAYSLDPDSSAEVKIAEWGPAEQNPAYRRTLLTREVTTAMESCCSEGEVYGCANPVGEAIVRLEVYDTVVDSDWLMIGDLLALKHGMKALQLRDQEKYAQAEIETQEAIRILRAGNEKYSPGREVRVSARPMQWAPVTRIFAGFR